MGIHRVSQDKGVYKMTTKRKPFIKLEPTAKFSDFEPGVLRGEDFFRLLDKVLKEIYEVLNELRVTPLK